MNHTSAPSTPTTPMVMNMMRQPNASIRPVSSGGAMNGPMLPPEL